MSGRPQKRGGPVSSGQDAFGMSLRSSRGNTHQRVYRVVKQIPQGRVATYGQIARLARLSGGARQVGYALRALGDDSVPWHRVINAEGKISPRADAEFVHVQRRLLEAEGVRFDEGGRVPLSRFGWRPRRHPRNG